jgi:four helix bundle protein
MKVRHYKELEVYQMAFGLQQAVFVLSKAFPKAETYALTDQVRRSARSVGANLAEAWAKRRYPASFLNKLTDSDAELQETEHWLDTALACDYLDDEHHSTLVTTVRQVGGKLGSMIANHTTWCL